MSGSKPNRSRRAVVGRKRYTLRSLLASASYAGKGLPKHEAAYFRFMEILRQEHTAAAAAPSPGRISFASTVVRTLVHLKCLECANGDMSEVRSCHICACPLWPIRRWAYGAARQLDLPPPGKVHHPGMPTDRPPVGDPEA